MSKFLDKLKQKTAQFDSWWDSSVEPMLDTKDAHEALGFAIGAIVMFVVCKTIL